MRRRDFVKVIVGSSALWPLAARAQHPSRERRIGGFTAYEFSMSGKLLELLKEGLRLRTIQ
jgi:hypothetical protein